MHSNYCEEDPQSAQKFEPHEVSAQAVCNPLFPENNMQLFVCVIYTSNYIMCLMIITKALFYVVNVNL